MESLPSIPRRLFLASKHSAIEVFPLSPLLSLHRLQINICPILVWGGHNWSEEEHCRSMLNVHEFSVHLSRSLEVNVY